MASDQFFRAAADQLTNTGLNYTRNPLASVRQMPMRATLKVAMLNLSSIHCAAFDHARAGNRLRGMRWAKADFLRRGFIVYSMRP
jgi:hypothetical protein